MTVKGMEAAFVFEIACGAGAKGVVRQAVCETTITGVRWEITGDLAKAIRAYGATKGVGEPVAWMTEDGRVSTDNTKQTAMPVTVRESFCIPLYAAPTPPKEG